MNFFSGKSTPLPVIATVARLVSKVTDRIAGDRSEFPLLVACVTTEALRHYKIQANVFYGQAAWIEVMEDQSVLWAGCWGNSTHFWVATPYGEVVDLTVGVSHRKRSHANPLHRPKFSPPLLWARDVPKFYRYVPEGIADVELDSERDRKWFELCLTEVREKLPPLTQLLAQKETDLDFPEEAMVCPDKRILDDAAQSFRHYDRALLVQGIPAGPL